MTKDKWLIRSLTTADQPMLWNMLMYAAHETSTDAVKTNAELAQYVQDWGRFGDLGVVAEKKQQALGAAWLRLWSEGDCGYGYIDDETPELAIAVAPDYRGQGVGTELLEQVLVSASSKFSAICLSVRSENPALHLYKRMGFVQVDGTEIADRAGSSSFTMLRNLE